MRQPEAMRHSTLNGAVAIASILLFVGIGSVVLTDMFAHEGPSGVADRTLAIALLLNIAIILFTWRRNRELSAALHAETQAHHRTQQLAAHDPLTGFLNRRSLAEEGAALLSQAHRRGKAVALLLIDLDRFKEVNDVHGHAIGDMVLTTIAAAIRDILPPTSVLARIGGDEFACMTLFDPTHPMPITRIAERLLAEFGTPVKARSQQFRVSASIGIARSDADGGTVDTLTRAADIAMYHGKRNGRDRYIWFEPAMAAAIAERGALESGLRQAIPRAEFAPFFEQQVDLSDESVTGFEVLARWWHPEEGLLGPDRFLTVAEESGMIADLSLSVMQQAFAAARDWAPSLTLSVNLSPLQLKDAWLAQKMVKLLAESGLPAGRLEVEITEAALLDNLAMAQSIATNLKTQGIRIVLDDFGTGYSSLAHLRAIPFDGVKIDKSLVTTMLRDIEAAATVQAIVTMCESLGLPVTAEGIEDRETHQRVAALGCVRGQGYLYGRAADALHTRRLLAERRLIPVAAAPAEPVKNRRRVG